MKKRVIVIGATGSIGRQTIDVLRSRPELFEVVGLSAHSNETRLLESASIFPQAVLALTGSKPQSERVVFHGAEAAEELIRSAEAEIVVNGAAGSAGLRVSLATLKSGKDLALANKESVVMGWGLLRRLAEGSSKRILPIDSEHAALFQLIHRVGAAEIEELTITASGGAFRNRPLEQLAAVTPDEAASHPNWSMGRKITIDSATMANKALEVIEASRLFDVPAAKVKVLIHPQSVVHALVRTRDGMLYAQLSEPDMRIPIQNALTWPENLSCPFGRLDLAGKRLDFQEVDPARFPFLKLAYASLDAGEGATVALNAADEIAVEAFEKGAVAFTDIAIIVEKTIERPWPTRIDDLGSIFRIDREAREAASKTQRELAGC